MLVNSTSRNRRCTYTVDQLSDFIIKCVDEEEAREDSGKSIGNLKIQNAEKIFKMALSADLTDLERNYYMEKYIQTLLDYGFYIKGQWEESGFAAKRCFENALKLSNNIPIAEYRLGHIAHKHEEHGEAIYHFTNALRLQNENKIQQQLKMDNVQIETAKKMIAYESLVLFQEYKVDAISHDRYLELDSLLLNYAMDAESKPIKCKFSDEPDYKMISIDERDELLDEHDILIVDRYSSDPSIGYNGKQISLKFEKIEILVQCFEKKDFNPFIPEYLQGREVRNNRRYIERLSSKICSQFGLSSDVLGLFFRQNSDSGMRPYVSFNPKVKTVILKRIED